MVVPSSDGEVEFADVHLLAPVFEELHCRSLIGVIPKSREALLQSPCLAGLQIDVVEALKFAFAALVGETA
jgi:hypothetical protein